MKADNDSLSLPGENFDLCGVLELFKKTASPQEFEKALNEKDNKVNNLDLNGDGKLDVIASGRATRNVKIYLNETTRQ